MTGHELRQPVLIAGAGIGGLTTALGLQRAGFRVRVFEQAEELREVGAGVSLAPNATRALGSLGLLEALVAKANRPDRAAMKHYATGDELTGYAMGDAMEERWGCPYLQIHRADLQQLLHDAVCAHDPDAVRLGARVRGLDRHGQGVTLHTAAGPFEGECAIGADGLRSVVRARLHEDTAPRFLGYVAWRGVVPAHALEHGPQAPDTAVFLGPEKSLLRYRVRGDTAVNIVAFARSELWAEEGWSLPADPAELRLAFRGWAPEVQELIGALCVHGVSKWGLFGRAPLARWQRGRATLVGDAAHPMLPFLGQGAGMAIEDGVTLARAMQAAAGIEEGLALYESSRRARTLAAVARADAQGLRLHSHPFEGDGTADVPRDDFGEFGFDASTEPLASVKVA